MEVSDLRGLWERERCWRPGEIRGGLRGTERLLAFRLRVVREGKCGISSVNWVHVRAV